MVGSDGVFFSRLHTLVLAAMSSLSGCLVSINNHEAIAGSMVKDSSLVLDSVHRLLSELLVDLLPTTSSLPSGFLN